MQLLTSNYYSRPAIRRFFKYLYETGFTRTEPFLMIAKDNYTKQVKLPSTYTAAEIEQMIAIIDPSKPHPSAILWAGSSPYLCK